MEDAREGLEEVQNESRLNADHDSIAPLVLFKRLKRGSVVLQSAQRIDPGVA